MTRVDETLFDGAHYLGRPADTTDRITTRRVELVKEIPNFCDKESTLLEIGCGNGATLLLMSSAMKKCVGVDIFDHTASFNEAVKEQEIKNCTISMKNIEAEDLNEKFDRLICFEVIEHFNKEETVKRFTRWLNPGALCAISVPNKWWIFETHGARLPFLPWNRVPFFSWIPTFMHERFANARIYTKSRIKKLLEESGFEVIEMQYITAPMDVLKESPLKQWMIKYIFKDNTTTIPFLSTSIFITARVK